MTYSKFSVPNPRASDPASVTSSAGAQTPTPSTSHESHSGTHEPSPRAEKHTETRAVTSRVTVVSRSTPYQTIVLHPEDNNADKLAFHTAMTQPETAGSEKNSALAGSLSRTAPNNAANLSAADTPAAQHSRSHSSGQAPENIQTSEPSHHQPEIVLTEPLPSPTASSEISLPFGRRPHGILPSLGMITAVCTLCLVSFILGCSLTDNALCRVMIAMSSVAAGRIPDQSLRDQLADSDSSTVYQKYMTQDQQAPQHDDTVRYLAAQIPEDHGDTASNPDISPESGGETVAPTGEVPVQNASEGKIGSDGEVLYQVFARDLSSNDLFSLSNETNYAPDVRTLLTGTTPALENLTINPGEPLVLIVHTHGTECYNASPHEGYYDAALPVRSENTEENVVGIGEELAKVLNDFGIPTLHSTKLCDKDSFVRAYSTSAAEVKSYLAEYPSIRFVIDLHRDSIAAADGAKTKPVFSFAGQNTAQLMFVVGTNAAGADHPGWQNNLSLALKLQNDMSESYPGLFRRINLRSASFNQQLSDGYLLLECGSCANSREEAARAARLFATGFARVIKSHAS